MPLESLSQEYQASREPVSGLDAAPADRVGDLGVTVETSAWGAAALSDGVLARVGPSNFDCARASV